MTVSTIVGCGYVGKKLARNLVDRGHEVYGVTRSGFEIEGIESLEIDVTEKGFSLPDSDYVYYLVSAVGRNSEMYRESYIKGLGNVIEEAGGEVIYSSSTGVYETSDGSWVDEETEIDPDSERSRVLLEAEEKCLDARGKVVRFAGLYGPGRHGLERYLGDSKVPKGYLNLVHRNDAASALELVATREVEHKLYVAVDDEPVDRHELARWLAEKTGREVGNLVDEMRRSNKRCSNERLREEGWDLEYPTYREGYLEAVEED